MSAIWGIIRLDLQDVDYNLGIQMEDAMNQYKLDRCQTLKKSNAVFGCGIQYITKEAVDEQLPYYDEDRRIFYTTDCMLDNRNELMEKLSLKETAIPDGALLYQAYLNWGEKFTDHVLGVFSMVIYDGVMNTCTLYTDHTGSRSLYYCMVESTIYFATVFAPLLSVLPDNYIRISENWMIACELSATPVMEFIPEATPFERINQVLAGHSVSISLQGSKATIHKSCYWGLKSIKKLEPKTNEEYRELFINTLYECVQSLLRSNANTGITLSSGLDSTSVACIAAQLLEGKGDQLYSFTSVPIEEFKGNKNPHYITDESNGVNIICEAYSNIEPEFVRCEGKNACSELNRMIPYLEFPHKSRQNMVWIDEIYEHAALKGCKVVLKGQFGNATISYGKILSRIYDDICHFKFRNAYYEMNSFAKINNISRKMIIKVFIKEFAKMIGLFRNKYAEDTIVRMELLDRPDIRKLLKRIRRRASDFLQSNRQRQEYIFDMSGFAQLGALDTRLGLYQGIIIRDPLKDKRIIELCCSLPMKCFVQDGIERVAVRKYMRGIVPDAILDNFSQRGLQSADYIARIRKDWGSTKEIVLKCLEQPLLVEYIDFKKLEEIKEHVRSDEIVNLESQLMNALMLCSCSVFLNNFCL